MSSWPRPPHSCHCPQQILVVTSWWWCVSIIHLQPPLHQGLFLCRPRKYCTGYSTWNSPPSWFSTLNFQLSILTLTPPMHLSKNCTALVSYSSHLITKIPWSGCNSLGISFLVTTFLHHTSSPLPHKIPPWFWNPTKTNPSMKCNWDENGRTSIVRNSYKPSELPVPTSGTPLACLMHIYLWNSFGK